MKETSFIPPLTRDEYIDRGKADKEACARRWVRDQSINGLRDWISEAVQEKGVIPSMKSALSAGDHKLLGKLVESALFEYVSVQIDDHAEIALSIMYSNKEEIE